MKNTWELLETLLPYDVYHAYTGNDGKCAYLFGGIEKETNAITNRCIKMNFETLEWTELTPMPFAMTNGMPTQAPLINGKFYIVGGTLKNEEVEDTTGRVFAYDIATDSWSEVASRPLSAGKSGICEAFGRIYSFGGFTKGSSTTTYYSDVYSYQPITNQWTRKADMRGYVDSSTTKNNNYNACGVFACHNGNGQIYVGGGTGFHSTSSSFNSSNTPPQTTALNIYVVNGDSWYTTYYDKHWNYGYTAEYIGHVAIEDKIFLLGGYSSGNSNEYKYNNSFRYINHYDGGANGGVAKEIIPERMYAPNVFSIEGDIYILGGYGLNTYTSNCYKYASDMIQFKVTLNWENPIPENSTLIPNVTNLTYKIKE